MHQTTMQPCCWHKGLSVNESVHRMSVIASVDAGRRGAPWLSRRLLLGARQATERQSEGSS